MAGINQIFGNGFGGGMVQPQMCFVPVQDEQAVNAYIVGAGNTVALADLNNGFMWIKSTSANGVPLQVRKFKLEEIVEQPQQPENAVSRQEFDELKQMIASLAASMSEPKKKEAKEK